MKQSAEGSLSGLVSCSTWVQGEILLAETQIHTDEGHMLLFSPSPLFSSPVKQQQQ